MEKRAVSHIEVVLAFLIFISAFSVIFYFFNPTNFRLPDSNQLNYLLEKVEENSQVGITEIGVVVNKSAAQISFDGKIAINTSFVMGAALNAIVVNSDKETMNISMDAPRFGSEVLCVKIDYTSSDDFIYVYLSDDFDAASLGSASCPADFDALDFSLGGVFSRSILSEKKLLLINDSYFTAYSVLKEELGVSKRDDFSIRIVFQDGEKIIMGKNITQNIEVVSLNKRVEVLRKDKSLQFADINLKIW